MREIAPRLTSKAITGAVSHDSDGDRTEVRGMDGNDWMAAKLVGLFGLIILALVAAYFFTMFN